MSKLNILNTVTGGISKVGFKLKKYSPEILVVAGVAGTVTSAVMACKATTKAQEIVDELQYNMDKIHQVADTTEADVYSEDDMKKDTAIVYAQTAVKFVKLYGPSVALGAASLACIVQSHNILKKRNVALAAAYTAVDKGFKEYRGRVVERFGKELDRELRYNIKAKEVETTVTNEDGTETTVTETVNAIDPNSIGDFARIFDDGCNGWSKDPAQNLMFLKSQQAYATDKLRRQKYLFMNDVYDMLGFPKVPEGQVVGWIYDEKNPVGDNFVDFGIYNIDSERARAFVNGYERNILLDFNHDGNILDLM